ncbi:MAG: hypothetical protein KF895_13645 [Parvibaculum sp.]|nr:hypothetical protein [Parvibaculum sp.]
MKLSGVVLGLFCPLLAALQVSSFAIGPDWAETYVDPIIGISFSASEVNFEKPPPELIQLCPEFAEQAPLLYASTTERADLYLIVGGRVPVYDDSGNPMRDENEEIKFQSGFGAVLEINEAGKKCRAISTPDAVLSGDVEGVSPDLISALADDAFIRYRNAFGAQKLREETSALGSYFSQLPQSIQKAFSRVRPDND